MNRPFLFLAGEYTVSLPIVFQRKLWQHTLSACEFEFSDNSFHRKGICEDLIGLIFYADMDDKEKEQRNLELIIQYEVPCYPDPHILLSMIDRHVVLQDCYKAGLVNHNVEISLYEDFTSLNEIGTNPSRNWIKENKLVVKTGNIHRGENKFLYDSYEKVEPWIGLATIEPFFEGYSCRVLFIGDDFWLIRIDNEQSWIKNSPGASIVELQQCDLPEYIVNHARSVKKYFNLDIAGVDYVVNGEKFYFLEVNQFPDLNVSDDEIVVAKKFFCGMMDDIESRVKERL